MSIDFTQREHTIRAPGVSCYESLYIMVSRRAIAEVEAVLLHLLFNLNTWESQRDFVNATHRLQFARLDEI